MSASLSLGIAYGAGALSAFPESPALAQSESSSHSSTFRGVESSGPIKETIKLSRNAREAIGLSTVSVSREPLSLEISTMGEIEAMPTRSFIQHALLSGRVSSVLVDLGQKVTAGQHLAILDSPEITKLSEEVLNSRTSISADIKKTRSQYASEIEQSQTRLQLAKSNYERMETLEKEKIASRKAKDTAKAELEVAKSQVDNLKRKRDIEISALNDRLDVTMQALLDRLRQVGVDQSVVDQMLKKNRPIQQVPVTSTRSGIVTDIQANPGETIGGTDPLFEILDLEKVWATADVYESDMGRVSVGQPVLVTAAALPGRKFVGKLTYVASEVDRTKRTLPVKAEIHNSDFMLKPDMFVKLYVQTEESATAILLPRESVIERTGHFFVYIEVKPGVYQMSRVETGRSLGDKVEILSGLNEGQKVVTSGAFQIDAQMLKSEGRTEQFSHPSESGHQHEHGDEEHDENSEQGSGMQFSPLFFVFGAATFILGSIITAIFVRSRGADSSRTGESSEETLESTEKRR